MSFVLVQKLKKKEVEPKIYAATVDGEHGEGVGLVVAYSLEEAMTMVKEDASKHTGGQPKDFRVRTWAYMDMNELKSRIFNLEVSDISHGTRDEKDAKEINEAMKKIVSDNNAKLFKKIKGRLSKDEVNYIEEKLSLKKYGKSNL